MPTSQNEIAGYFHILDRSAMISPHRISPIVFSIETRRFGPKKLYIPYKLTFQNSKPLSSLCSVCKFHCRNDNKIKCHDIIPSNN